MKLRNIYAPYAGLNSGIYILFISRVINSMGSFVFPFLALFLTGVMDMSEDKAGVFIMLSSFAGVPGTLLGGILADKIGRKVVLSLSMFLSAFLIIPCAFLGKSMLIPWLIILSVIFNSMSHPASSAMVADLEPPDKRGAAYALLYLGINIGMAVGPLIAGFLFKNHLKLFFMGEAGTTILAALLILMFIKESIPDSNAISDVSDSFENEKAEKGNTFAILLKRPYLLIYTFIMSVISFVYSQHNFSLPIFTEKIYGIDGPQIFGVIMSVNCIVVLIMTTMLTTCTKKFKPVLNTAFSALLYAFGFGILYFSGNYLILLISTILWTLGEILCTTSSQVYIADNSPVTHRARFNAVITFISRAGFTVGPAAMGLFIKNNGIRQVWPVLAILGVLSALCMYGLHIVEAFSIKPTGQEPEEA